MMTCSALGVQPEYIPAFTERARSIVSLSSPSGQGSTWRNVFLVEKKRCLPWTINTTPSLEPGYCRTYGGSAPMSHGEFMLGVSIAMVDREIYHLVAWM